MNSKNSVAAIYETHEQAEKAIKDLQEAGVNMKSLSIVGRDTHTEEHVVGYYTAGDRMKHWGGVGAFWGGFWGLLFGSGLFFIPGLGPILAAGPIVAWIVAALEGARKQAWPRLVAVMRLEHARGKHRRERQRDEARQQDR